MKKLGIVVLLALFAAGTIFAGAGKQSGGTTGAPNSNFNATGYPIVKEKITLKAAVNGMVLNGNPRVLWEELEKLTGIHVDFYGIETEQLATFMAAGDWPDFFHNNLNQSYINDNGILGHQFVDYFKILEYMPNLKQTLDEYPVAKKSATEINGEMYQLPTINNTVTISRARFYYRSDNLKKYNIAVPKTIDEFYNALVTLKKATGNAPWVSDIGQNELWFYPSFGSALVPDFDSLDGKTVVYNRAGDQYKRMLQFFAKCYKEGLLHQEFLTLDAATKLQMAKQAISTFDVTAMQNLGIEDFPSGEFDIGVPKPFTSQWNSNTNVRSSGSVRAGGFAMNAKSKYIPEIARLLDIAYATKEVAPGTGLHGLAFTYGPEGKTWKYLTADRSEYDFIMPPEHANLTPTVFQYDWVIYSTTYGRYEFGNGITVSKSNNRTRQLGFRDNLNANLVFDPLPEAFLKFTEAEQAVRDSKQTDMNAYVTEMRSKFITGVLDIDKEWANYVRTLNGMGVADVVKVYQQAYDRWNAK